MGDSTTTRGSIGSSGEVDSGGATSATGGRAGDASSGGGAGVGGAGVGGAGVGGASVGGGGGGGGSDAACPGAPESTGTVVGTVESGVRWIGRADTSDPAGPKFSWSGTGFAATIYGTSIKVKLANDNAYFFQPVIDGKKGSRFAVEQGQGEYTLGTGLDGCAHHVELYRETEANAGTSQFLGVTEGTLLSPPTFSGRVIEIIGDSISAGYGNLGSEEHPNYGDDPNGGCPYSYETQSAYETYGALAARNVNADASIIAISGFGMYQSNQNSMNDVLPEYFDHTLGLLPSPTWAFATEPDAVVINLGTNDFAMGDPGSGFVDAYVAFTSRIRTLYPDAWIFCAAGPMLSGDSLTQLDAYLNQTISERADAGDTRISLLDLGAQDALNGTGCQWHPNVAEHERLAGILTSALKSKLGW